MSSKVATVSGYIFLYRINIVKSYKGVVLFWDGCLGPTILGVFHWHEADVMLVWLQSTDEGRVLSTTYCMLWKGRKWLLSFSHQDRKLGEAKIGFSLLT
ncbi:hypothetical protein K1719_035818 [Acacia pycnantha]|nr:hypothetical protein K1719_035672 [Acacia pycnantha]KAI9082395.1 hypothetical protein K1719_035818 [Acacia pycnantha]